MSNFYIADTHFGHANAIIFDNRPKKTIEEMDEFLINNWNSVVTNNDHVYILGDFAFRNEKPISYYTDRLKGHLHLIKGNHDKINEQTENCFESIDNMLIIKDMLDGVSKTVALCHWWMPFIGEKKIMLYGHTHTSPEYVLEVLLQNELKRNNYAQNYYNVGCMHLDYYPRTLEQIVHRTF